MMTKAEREAALKAGMSGPWQAEPMFGSIYGEEEIEAAVSTIRASMDPSVGFGFITEETEEFERRFADYCGTKHAVSLSTASVGLDMAMGCLELEPGDEVIVPAINFQAAPLSVIGQGGRVVFCEVDPKTLCADPADVEQRITPRTRAILPTHMNGLSASMDELIAVAQRHPHPKHGPLKVIGDAARACGGGYRGTKIGKKGWMTIFSFHTMKNMNTLGEGGMITTDDEEVAARLRAVRQWGAGERWGSSYKMTKVQAAVGLVQLRRLDSMIAARRRLAEARSAMLSGCPHVMLPAEPEGYEHSWYMYTMLVSREWAGEKRDRLMALLKDKHGVSCGIFNRPVYHASPFIRRETQGQALPLSDELGERLFCPAIHPAMSDADNAYIAAAVWEAVAEVAGGS
ncbi:MAG: DegT/DnrJ/EryC1/StrS family aminotransferase [Armatimonadota bacterium]